MLLWIAVWLTFACLVAGCGAASNGKVLKMTNDTPVTVIMRSCTEDFAAGQRCSAPERIAPRGSADFSLPGKSAPVKMVRVTGYGRQALCFIIPPDTLPADVFADVTQVQPGNCPGFNS